MYRIRDPRHRGSRGVSDPKAMMRRETTSPLCQREHAATCHAQAASSIKLANSRNGVGR